MEVTLKKIKLSYFKGVKSLNIGFEPGENFIYGKNEAGKTTVFDSLWFLFFGKDSNGRADFSIKTYDSNNKVIEKVDHEVEGQFLINGSTKTFKRTYKEQWSKTTNTLTGHTTDYETDGYPIRTETEYKKQVEECFKEDIFKLLTNPLFFNSMKPADRRSALISLVPELTDAQVFEYLPSKSKKSVHIQKLEYLLGEGKKIESIKLKAAQDKKNFREEKDAIPGRIDEAARSKPEAYEFEELQDIIEAKKKELAEIDQKIIDSNNTAANKNQAVQDWQNRIFELKATIQKLEFQAAQDFRTFQNEQYAFPNQIQEKMKELNAQAVRIEESIASNKNRIQLSKPVLESLESQIAKAESDRAALRTEWTEQNEKEFTWNGTSCTACERPLEGAQALDAEEKARAKFNTAKANRLAEISAKGKGLKAKSEENQSQVTSYNRSVQDLELDIRTKTVLLDSYKADLINLESAINEFYSTKKDIKTQADFLKPEYTQIKAQITELEANKPEETKPDNTAFLAEKQVIQTALEGLQKALGNKETIEKIDIRIAELKEKELSLAEAITQAEGMEHACFTFSKARMEQIETTINSKFELVSFKMFHIPIQGEEKEICETIYKGVPFQDLNTAGKIQAGLDIINALSTHYDMYLPIFIDNRESTHWIPQVKAQVVNLVATPDAEKLRVESSESILATA